MTIHVNWRQDAACRDADPELFFPVGTAGPALRQIREAKRICRGCPAQSPCLAWALDHGVTDGVWEEAPRTSGAPSAASPGPCRTVRKTTMPGGRGLRPPATPLNAQPAAHDQPR